MQEQIPAFDHCRIERDQEGLYTATITGAGELNILSSTVTRSLTEAMVWLRARDDARAVILRGSGERAFLGGANIYEMAECTPQTARAFIAGLRDLCEAVRGIPVPTIARIPGICLGAGLELAAACDMRLAAPAARFGMPEVRIGIPSVIHAALLPGLIGQGATNWLLLTGEMLGAEEACRMGLVEFVSADQAGLDALIARSTRGILESGPAAVRTQKALLRHWQGASLEAAVANSVEVFGASFRSDEPQRYMAPFVARRAARKGE
ncbi:MAG: enoyl-CoA hydratase [Rhodobacteraceae bacterium]|nr:enoyl-CoA hydratase [Paracoccaceae bacterium]MBR9823603.1 enoyl-CoA hydratase [Paracoccaceae bacterium]